jgi:branched-chain amino acid transport system ATP-binding protein
MSAAVQAAIPDAGLAGARAGEPAPLLRSAPVLRVEHLSMRFGGLIAVNDVSFAARRGDITALIGPNGAGKTTVFNCITGFYKPTEGRIALQFGDADVWDELDALTERGTRRAVRGDGVLFLLERMPDYLVTQKAKVARTFQNIRLFQGMTVLENLLVAQHNRLMRASGFTVFGALGLPAYARAERAAIAMCTDPVLLCLDEPAAGLNPNESAELGRYLHAIREQHATSILLIEHDMSVVMEISDHIIVLDHGLKIADGTPEEIRNDPKVIAAYLGVEEDEVADGKLGAL